MSNKLYSAVTGRELLLERFDAIVDHKSCTRDLVAGLPIPEHFWKASASTTGKYHPTFSVGPGGLLNHTVLNMYWCWRWANFFGSKPGVLATAVAAAALHDTYKGGYVDDWNTTVPDHPFIAANEIRKFAQLNAENEGIRDRWYEVADAIWTHMGIFSADPRRPVNREFMPVTLDNMSEAGRIVALADYAAAQKVYDELPTIIGSTVDEPFGEDIPF